MGNNPNEVSRKVSQAICHPAYSWYTLDNDICLLRLSAPVNFTDYISPVCLAAANSTILSRTRSWITGWGKADNGKLAPGRPRHANPIPFKVVDFPLTCPVGHQEPSQTSSRRWRCPSWETTSADAPTPTSLTTCCVPATPLGGRTPARWVFPWAPEPNKSLLTVFLTSAGRLWWPPGGGRQQYGLGPGWGGEFWNRLRPAQHSRGLRPRVPVPGLDQQGRERQPAGLRFLQLVWV